MSIEKNKKLKELINKFIKEYTGTGASGGNAGDGNSITSPRPYPDEKTEMQKAYMDKNVGYGGDGGHYLQEPAFKNFNRHRTPKFEQLKKAIRTYIEQEVKENTFYGNREQPSQLSTGTKVSVPTDEYPFSRKPKRTATGMMEDIDSEIEKNNKEKLKNQLDAGDLTIKGSELNLKKLKSQNALAQQQTGKTVGDADTKKAQEANDVIELKRKLVLAKNELDKLETKKEYRPEDITSQEDELISTSLPLLISQYEEQLEKETQEKDSALQAYQQAVKSKTSADKGMSDSQRQASQAHQKLVRDTKKQQQLTKKQMSENLLKNYFNSRKNTNLMEHIDSYKRTILLEGAIKKFFELFDREKTDEEVIKFYADQGVIVPEQFVKKARDHYKKVNHEKLDLASLEQETKEFKKIPLTDENVEYEEDFKQLASGLVNENEIIARYEIPPEIKDTLINTLKMDPLIRFVENLKAINSIPPSYRVFLLNGQYFDIIYETYSLMVKIGTKEYFLGNIDEKNYAIKHINKLLTQPMMKKDGSDDKAGDLGDLLKDLPKKGGASKPPAGGPPSPPPPPPSPEPEA